MGIYEQGGSEKERTACLVVSLRIVQSLFLNLSEPKKASVVG